MRAECLQFSSVFFSKTDSALCSVTICHRPSSVGDIILPVVSDVPFPAISFSLSILFPMIARELLYAKEHYVLLYEGVYNQNYLNIFSGF